MLYNRYYHTQDYTNALVYLNQVTDQQYINDAVRYMILSYYHTQQTDRMMDWFRYLLSEQKLHKDDFILLFDIAFYEPYMKYGSGATFDIAKISLESNLNLESIAKVYFAVGSRFNLK